MSRPKKKLSRTQAKAKPVENHATIKDITSSEHPHPSFSMQQMPAWIFVTLTSFGIAIAMVVLVIKMEIISNEHFWRSQEESFQFGCSDGQFIGQESPENSEQALKSDSICSAHEKQFESAELEGKVNIEQSPCRHPSKQSCQKVDKRQKLSLQEFREIYDGKWPVIITDVMSSWPALNWTIDFFKKKYGRSRVTMTTFANSVKSGFSVPLEVFLNHLHVSTETVWTYLQDELFLLQHPELKADIFGSIYTEQDLFQLFPAAVRPWDCMLLWGTAHSRSSLHIDPYNWTGTNAVISGLKRWKLLPPGQDKLLSIHPGANCGFPLECVKYNSALDLFDSAQLEAKPDLRYLEVDQGPGEMLFIPSGWFHQAYNVVPTLAVSGQVMNTNNYEVVLTEIFKGGSVQRSALPDSYEKMAPADVVRMLASHIPQHVLDEGERRTANALKQLYMPMP
ncbi:bifunctional arginine demethylase and lysyl-hydroxylase jmjd6-like [Plakobranchus ocellatus]|uniref:Bifunctional arginine demethylase and lysyl-hydroxylase jmjd6-like n=1 Tax=Plakobranchus ocellatus TaxID=259542 RepID=A0AAV3XWU9_9GAST|nr:bifunctional arginine demethylase and lysyl-hydroxylase jmjd6-like [Plakobranchus ocellatus]